MGAFLVYFQFSGGIPSKNFVTMVKAAYKYVRY